MAQIVLAKGASPNTPSNGKVSLFVKNDGTLSVKTDEGVESPLMVDRGQYEPVDLNILRTSNIGVNVQQFDADLDAIASISTTGLIERTGIGAAGTVAITAAGKAILDDSDNTQQRITLGLGNSSTLDVGTGSGTVAAGDHSHTFSSITSKPTTLSGYGITDAVPVTSYTAEDVLSKIKAVDGAGSDLDADLLDGKHASEFATVSQGAKADSALQSSAIGSTVCSQIDSRLSDSREWTATTIDQAEAEAGTATTRRAWTAQRVFQAIGAWWNVSAAKSKLDGIATGATANATDAQLRDRATHTGTQAVATITGLGGAATLNVGTSAGTVCAGDDNRLTNSRTPTSHTHGNITNTGAIGSTANLPVITTTSGALTTGTFGTGANTFCQGNDARLSDARTPTTHTHPASAISDSTAAGRALLTGDDAAAQRTSLGLGTAATTATTAYATAAQGAKADTALQPADVIKQVSATDRTPGHVALAEYVQLLTTLNDIGVAGEQGFGVGVCPANILPAGIFPITGHDQFGHPNYGNYITTNGSVMVYVPKFYYRIASASSPRFSVYGLNCIDVVSSSSYANRAAATAAGYVLPRCFIDAGSEISGFFIDKYLASADGVGSCKSIPNVDVLSLFNNVSHAPITGGMTGCTGFLADAVVLSRARGNGFYCTSIFQYSAIALLSLAHAQAVTSVVNCAWYDPTGVRNFPKGCNNNALADVNDTSVTFAAGTTFAAKGKTRAITGFTKTTHNGQECGVADINGILWEAAMGVTAAGLNSTSTAPIANGDVYVLKESARMSDLTAGFGGANDVWGDSTSLLANYDLHTGFFPWGSDTGWIRFGNGSNQVFSESGSGVDWLRSSAGVQRDNNAVSGSGTNLFGVDGCFKSNRMNMLPVVGGNWSTGSDAGVFSRNWNRSRSYSSDDVGFRCALSAFG